MGATVPSTIIVGEQNIPFNSLPHFYDLGRIITLDDELRGRSLLMVDNSNHFQTGSQVFTGKLVKFLIANHIDEHSQTLVFILDKKEAFGTLLFGKQVLVVLIDGKLEVFKRFERAKISEKPNWYFKLPKWLRFILKWCV